MTTVIGNVLHYIALHDELCTLRSSPVHVGRILTLNISAQ